LLLSTPAQINIVFKNKVLPDLRVSLAIVEKTAIKAKYRIMRTKKIIVSASRRTDIPAFHMAWFMKNVKKQIFKIKNPVSNKTSILFFSPENIQAIFFWSKDYTKAISKGYFTELKNRGFELFFHYTINSEIKILEPGIKTSLENRLKAIRYLAEEFGPERIFWRFDPILFYKEKNHTKVFNNLKDFEKIALFIKETGIKQCITSFADQYKKSLLRFDKTKLDFIEIDESEKKRTLNNMNNILKQLNISLSLCCEPELNQKGAYENHPCISGEYTNKLLKTFIPYKRAIGQRKGCICSKSLDIGSYIDHPCMHNCIYCYAS